MNDWSFTLAYGLLLAFCLFLAKERPSNDVLSPGLVFPVLLFAYSLASTLFVNEMGYTNFGYRVDRSVLDTFYICSLVGLSGFFGGRYLSLHFPVWHFRAARGRTPDESAFSDKAVFYAVLLGVVAAPFIYQGFNVLSQPSYADLALQSRVEAMEDEAAGLKTVFLVKTPVTLILCASTLLVFDRTRGIAVRCAGALAIGLNLAANLLGGWRGHAAADQF